MKLQQILKALQSNCNRRKSCVGCDIGTRPIPGTLGKGRCLLLELRNEIKQQKLVE